MKIKVSNYIAQKLVEEGISHVFSVTGGGAMHLNDGLGHQKGLHCVYNHHEQACAIAAECYARIENRIAAVCVTTGPGGTNAITGVVGGWLDSIPMLILSGQVRYDTTARWSGVGIRALGDQEFDICQAVECMTKYCEMVTDPHRIRYCLEKALYLARSGRPGPCWLDIPMNVQGAFVEKEELAGFDAADYEAGGTGWGLLDENAGTQVPKEIEKAETTEYAGRRSTVLPVIEEDYAGKGEKRQVLPEPLSQDVLIQIIDKIKNAKRPVFNAGNGIRIAGGHGDFLELVELLGIPVVTGWNSIDTIWDEHSLYVGRAGHMGDRPGNFAVQNSDLVLSVGSRLSIRQVGYNYPAWAREAYVIMNDVDREELRKPTLHVELPVHADSRVFMEALIQELKNKKEKGEISFPVFGGGEGIKGTSWIATCRMWKEKYPVVLPHHMAHTDEEPVNVYAAVKELGSRLCENQITVVGNGSACVVGGHAYIMKKGQRFISNSAIASMGYDLPAAIGAWFAGSSHDIILLTGDGSIQMNLQELQTIIHHRMGIKIFLINNGGYHSIRQSQKNFFGEPLVGVGVDSGFEGPDLSFPQMEKLAEAYGYPYFAAYHNSGLAGAIERTLAVQGPAICEFFVSCDQNFEPKSSSKRLPDGTMISPPLEDLAPFLSEEEMEENMIIPRMNLFL